MALTKTIQYKGITIGNAYIRAEAFSGDKDGLIFHMRAYKDEQSALDINNILSSEAIRFVPSQLDTSERWDKQAYAFAKTLEAYTDAEDC